MASATGPQRIAVCLLGAAASWLTALSPAVGFPLTDQTPSVVPSGGELTAPDAQTLQHQMQLLSGFGSAGGGWTFLPRLTGEEIFNDNVFSAHSPRRWDLITEVSPGIAIVGDTARIKLRLNYQPSLQIYTRTGSQNALTQQLDAVGTVTLVPDMLFVDVRGLEGTQDVNGGIGGLGTVGASGLSPITAGGLAQTNQLGLSKQNLAQTSSFAVSPYMLYQFGDFGSGRVGVSLSSTNTSQLSGFTAPPWPSGGNNSQQENSIEESASFQTGDVLSRLRDQVTLDANQSQSSARGFSGGNTRSERDTLDNRVDYAINRIVSIYGDFGYQRIDYSGDNQLNINGPIWGFGTTLTPNPDTSVTFGYGRRDGSTSFTFDGRYAVSPRTTVTGSYHTGIETQSGLIRNQLNLAGVDNNGVLVNRLTGQPLFLSNNALGLTPGVFRFSTLTFGATTTLDRDTIDLTLSRTTQTPTGSGTTTAASTVTAGGVVWTHQVHPDLLLSASLYYSTGTPNAGASEKSIAAGLGAQYTLSETVSAFARYAYYQRQSNSSALSMFQDLLLVGVTKQF